MTTVQQRQQEERLSKENFAEHFFWKPWITVYEIKALSYALYWLCNLRLPWYLFATDESPHPSRTAGQLVFFRIGPEIQRGELFWKAELKCPSYPYPFENSSKSDVAHEIKILQNSHRGAIRFKFSTHAGQSTTFGSLPFTDFKETPPTNVEIVGQNFFPNPIFYKIQPNIYRHRQREISTCNSEKISQ